MTIKNYHVWKLKPLSHGKSRQQKTREDKILKTILSAGPTELIPRRQFASSSTSAARAACCGKNRFLSPGSPNRRSDGFSAEIVALDPAGALAPLLQILGAGRGYLHRIQGCLSALRHLSNFRFWNTRLSEFSIFFRLGLPVSNETYQECGRTGENVG